MIGRIKSLIAIIYISSIYSLLIPLVVLINLSLCSVILFKKSSRNKILFLVNFISKDDILDTRILEGLIASSFFSSLTFLNTYPNFSSWSLFSIVFKTTTRHPLSSYRLARCLVFLLREEGINLRRISSIELDKIISFLFYSGESIDISKVGVYDLLLLNLKEKKLEEEIVLDVSDYIESSFRWMDDSTLVSFLDLIVQIDETPNASVRCSNSSILNLLIYLPTTQESYQVGDRMRSFIHLLIKNGCEYPYRIFRDIPDIHKYGFKYRDMGALLHCDSLMDLVEQTYGTRERHFVRTVGEALVDTTNKRINYGLIHFLSFVGRYNINTDLVKKYIKKVSFDWFFPGSRSVSIYVAPNWLTPYLKKSGEFMRGQDSWSLLLHCYGPDRFLKLFLGCREERLGSRSPVDFIMIEDTEQMMHGLINDNNPDIAKRILPKKPKSIREIHDALSVYLSRKNRDNLPLPQEWLVSCLSSHSNKEYSFFVPQDVFSLIDLGNRLKICVGSGTYTDRILSRESVIFSVKKRDTEFCVEYSLKEGTIIQISGYRNSSPEHAFKPLEETITNHLKKIT